MVSDGESFFHDERRHLKTSVEPLDKHALGVRITNRDPEGRYRLVKEVITGPREPTVLVRARLLKPSGGTSSSFTSSAPRT